MVPRKSKFVAPAWPELSFEKELWISGKKYIAGVDEAGRGAWAGPVTAAAVILPFDDFSLGYKLAGVRDSKLMSAAQREKWSVEIRKVALVVCSGWADHTEIDELGILPATRLAMLRAIESLCHPIDHLLIDAVALQGIYIPQTSLIKGDARSLSIAAASIIAKTSRDHHMELLEEEIPGYGFARHKGYGTVIHHSSLKELGVSPVHRRSYAPIKVLLSEM